MGASSRDRSTRDACSVVEHSGIEQPIHGQQTDVRGRPAPPTVLVRSAMSGALSPVA